MLHTQRQTVMEYPMAPTRKTSTCCCIYHSDFVYVEIPNGSKFLMLVMDKLIKEKTYHVKVLGKYFK